MFCLPCLPFHLPVHPHLPDPCCAAQSLLEAFDATNATPGMMWALIHGWCGDVAAALASHAADIDPDVHLAANAAAGRWGAVVRQISTVYMYTTQAQTQAHADPAATATARL